MDDNKTAIAEAWKIEFWINKQLKAGQPPEYIADELLKKWDASEFSIETKNSVARFCLLNGLYPPLLRILKLDLRSGTPLPWPAVTELFFSATKVGLQNKLTQAIIAGATIGKQLHGTAAVALSNAANNEWADILATELRERAKAAKEEREKLFKELQIYKAERMDAEMAQVLIRILSLFPGDPDATSMYEKLGEQELDVRIDKLRQQYKLKQNLLEEVEKQETWPELDDALKKIQTTLNLEQIYLLSIALFQMNFYDKSLHVLRHGKSKWRVREKLWEIELLLMVKLFAEALGAAQIVLNENRTDNVVVKTALYFSARAYHGLSDREQAASILRGIIEHDPYFRDANILIAEWDNENI